MSHWKKKPPVYDAAMFMSGTLILLFAMLLFLPGTVSWPMYRMIVVLILTTWLLLNWVCR